MGFAENLKAELEFQDMQVQELSQKTGISRNTISKYLFGSKSQPSAENAVKIARVLGVTVEYLINGQDGEVGKACLTFEQRKIISDYSKLNNFNRQTVRDVLQSLVSRQ